MRTTIANSGLTPAWRYLLAAACLACALADGAAAKTEDVRLERMRGEISRLQRELNRLSSRERGLLGELERLGAELRLRAKELDEASLRRQLVGEALAEGQRRLADLQTVQAGRKRYLRFRLREIYKSGPEDSIRAMIGGDRVEAYWAGLRYASFLSERDGRILAEFRADAEQARLENEGLQAKQVELDRVVAELAVARRKLESSRRQRGRLLTDVREDKQKRESALAELEGAATELGRLVSSFPSGERAAPTMDVRKFRGLLDWPATGTLGSGFGTVVHPRFKTRVPHPGLDIDGEFGAPIHSVFDGEIVFASWMRGYGLTAIVDHGSQVLSIYAHASVLLVEPGQTVIRGQKLGMIGDTGSLRGPYLYFELRVDGTPVDPSRWLRPRVAK